MTKPIKLIILDAGGVIQPDAELGAPNQPVLAKISGLSDEELNAMLSDGGDVHDGSLPLLNVFQHLAKRLPAGSKYSPEELLNIYKKGIAHYPGAVQLIWELFQAGYHVVLLTNNSDQGLVLTRELLAREQLSYVRVYGSAEFSMKKPNPKIFEIVCAEEKVSPEECLFVDDRESNRKTALQLGMSVIALNTPVLLTDALSVADHCRQQLIDKKILREANVTIPQSRQISKLIWHCQR